MPAPHRAPVLVPGPLGGLSGPDAAHRRVSVDDDGAVVLLTERGRTVLAEPGGVTRVVHVGREQLTLRSYRPAPTRGLVALLGPGGVVAAFSLAEWSVELVQQPDDAALRATAGFEAVAERLGLVVEGASPADLEALRKVGPADVVTSRSLVLRTAWLPLGLLAGAVLLGFAAVPLSGEGAIGAVAALVALALGGPVVVALWRGRRRLVALAAQRPDAGGRHVVRSVLPLEVGGLARSELHLGADYVVLHDRTWQTWLPGPALGGAVRLVRGDRALVLQDHRGRTMLVLDPAVWGPEGPLEDAARAAGLEPGRSADLDLEGAWADSGLAFAAATTHPSAMLHDAETGGASGAVSPLAHVAAWTTLVGFAAATTWSLLALPLLLLALVELALALDSWRLLRAWDRALRTRPLETTR